jgi:hypothetical protein
MKLPGPVVGSLALLVAVWAAPGRAPAEEQGAAPPAEAAAPEAAPVAASEATSEPAGEPAAPLAAPEEPDPGPPPAPASGVALGAVGYDAQGRPGRVHMVVAGDTLWDISEAYLGTPWVWPSVWQDNAAIANPHLIHPGDRIWITPSEMRRVTEAEAAALLAGKPAEEVPASLEDGAVVPERDLTPPVFPVGSLDALGLVSPRDVEAAASVVDSPVERVWLAEADTVFLGLGEGQTRPGDRFTIFRTTERVLHPKTGEVYGYHVEVLGWAEVERVEGETAVAQIRQSYSEIRRGDRVLPRPTLASQVELRAAASPVEGVILFTPHRRTRMGSADVVYLDRGSLDGLEVGNPVEVYRPGVEAAERARGETVHTPDWVVAKALVVSLREESAVALVTHASTELERGDLFRTTGDTKLR